MSTAEISTANIEPPFWNQETLQMGMQQIGAEVQPPLEVNEWLAITGLLNGLPPTAMGVGEEDEVRYKIVIRAGRHERGEHGAFPIEPRYLQLRGLLRALSENEEVIRKEVGRRREIEASLVAEA
jgi:hypothetical protein